MSDPFYNNVTLLTYTNENGEVKEWNILLWRLVVASALFVFSILSFWFVKCLFKVVIFKITKRTKTKVDDAVVAMMPRPVFALVSVGCWYGCAVLLDIPDDTVPKAFTITTQVVTTLLLVAIFYFFWRAIDAFSMVLEAVAKDTPSQLDDQIIPFLRKSLKVVLFLVVLIVVLNIFNIDTSAILGASGVFALAISLASQDTVKNVFGAILIFTEKPFQVGDHISFSGTEGTVHEVNFRSCIIKRFDGASEIVPNMIFSTAKIVNYFRSEKLKIRFKIAISTETTMESLRTLMRVIKNNLLKNQEIDQSAVKVNFVAIQNEPFPAYIVDINTRWVKGPGMIEDDTERNSWSWFGEYVLLKEDVFFMVCESLENMGISFAHPTRFNYNRDHIMKQQEQLRLISSLKGNIGGGLSVPKKPVLLATQKKIATLQSHDDEDDIEKYVNKKVVDKKAESLKNGGTIAGPESKYGVSDAEYHDEGENDVALVEGKSRQNAKPRSTSSGVPNIPVLELDRVRDGKGVRKRGKGRVVPSSSDESRE